MTSTSNNRYASQTAVIGEAGQTRLEQARVLVIGAGGLGCPALLYLVGAGIGHIHILDADRIEAHNLHRQILFTEHQCGQSKAQTAMEQLKQHNSAIRITASHERLTPDNADDWIKSFHLVLDCADNLAVSYTLSDACYRRGIPLLSASVVGDSGYVVGCCGAAPSLRALFPDPPAKALNCTNDGVLGPVVGMIGSLQAQCALSILLSLTPSPLGQITRITSNPLHCATFRFDQAQEPKSAPLVFIGKNQLTDSDYIIDLCRTQQTLGQPTHTLNTLSKDSVQATSEQRIVVLCKTGLNAWRNAQVLQTFCDNPMVLMAESAL